MALNWKSVGHQHVVQACALLKQSGHVPPIKQGGLYVECQGEKFPAKSVLAYAYRMANGLPEGSSVKFSSGDSTITRLRALGFTAGRDLKGQAERHE